MTARALDFLSSCFRSWFLHCFPIDLLVGSMVGEEISSVVAAFFSAVKQGNASHYEGNCSERWRNTEEGISVPACRPA